MSYMPKSPLDFVSEQYMKLAARTLTDDFFKRHPGRVNYNFGLIELHVVMAINLYNRTVRTSKEFGMATKYKNSIQWLPSALTEEEKTALKADETDLMVVMGDMWRLLERGVKWSCSYRVDKDSYQVTATCFESGHEWEGKGYSSWAKTPEMAMRVAWFKHYVAWAEDWGNAIELPEEDLFG